MLLMAVLLMSCNTSKEILYFQDINVNQPEVISGARDITVQPKDQISILVSSKDPQLAALFNLTRAQARVGTVGERYLVIRWMTKETLTFPYWAHFILPV
mgnify:CR=1 FL=1